MDTEQLLQQVAESNARLAATLEKLGGQFEAYKGQTEKAEPANAMGAQRLHGLGGLFSGPGLEREVITAAVRPYGIGAMLPLLPSVNEDPRFMAITGISAPNGAQPASACLPAPTSYMKTCQLTAYFGLKRFDTETIEFDKVMLKVNRGDLTDLVLYGRLLGIDNLGPELTEADVLNIVTKAEMVKTGVQFERALNIDMWQGTVAAGTFPGLDAQIVTGQVDAATGTACPSLDSDVKDFNYDDVGGNARDIVEYVSMLEYYLTNNAEGSGVDPVQWVIAMRPQLWYELSAVWPCRYMTNRCSNLAGTSVAVINDNVNIAMRDDLRKRKVLPINGREYPVILDTGIFEHNNQNNANLQPGQYASSLYMVPLTISGDFPVTYREFIDYRQGAGDVSLLNGNQQFWTDNGIYSWAFVGNNYWCYYLGAKTEQRVVLRTPWLAGKIQRIRYTPLQHVREPDPDSPYWVDGGVSMRLPGTRYAPWLPGGYVQGKYAGRG